MKFFKGIVTVVLVIIMIIKPIGFAASADDLGENITWSYDQWGDYGTLYIYGEGAMCDYDSTSEVPWYSYRDGITEIMVGDEVTTIGDCAFSTCRNLTYVSLPEGITKIGDSAFATCGMGDIYLPDSVTTVGDHAFANCIYLSDIYIPRKVTTIGEYAFTYCSYLERIAIPDSVTTIGEGAFEDCDRLCSATIGNSLSMISDSLFFECNSLQNITIPNNVETVGKLAFGYCNNLKRVTIGKGVTTISDNAFIGCDNLTDVYYNGTEEEWNANVVVGKNNNSLLNATFHFVTAFTETTISNGGKTFSVEPHNVPEGDVIVLATYNGDTLAEVKTFIYASEENITFHAAKDYTKAKVFVWEDLIGFNPVCEEENVKLN